MPENTVRADRVEADAAGTAATTLSLVGLFNIALRHRRLVVGMAIGLTVVYMLAILVAPRLYTVESSFIVQNSEMSAAAGLAAKLGVDVGGVDASQSPNFYVALVTTPDLLEPIATAKYATSDNPRPRELAELFHIKEPDGARRQLMVMRELKKSISSSLGLKFDLISLEVTTRDPLLSRNISDALLGQVNKFNLQTRQSRASTERRFAEERMNELRGEVRVKQQELQRFFEENRQQYLSAERTIKRDQILADLGQLQGAYSGMVETFERARIDEVRDTPVITVIQKPVTPVLPDPRGVATKSIMMLVLGLVLGLSAALAREAMAWLRVSKDAEAREFASLMAATSADMSRLKSAVPGLSRSSSSHPVA